MTTMATPLAAPMSAPSLLRRIINVVRVHIANPWPTLVSPWLVYGVVFGLNVAIWYAVVVAAGGRENIDAVAFSSNGGVSWIYVYMMVVAIQAMNLTFSFALGVGLTRRDYYLGTAVYFTALAALFALGITAFGAIESATDGWGVNGRFFAPWVVGDMAAWRQCLFHFAMMMFFFFFGSAAGSVWVRWRAVGLYLFIGSLLLMTVGLVWIASVTGQWAAVGRFLTGHSPIYLAAWSVPVTVGAALAGYALMRRATPRD